MNTARKIIGLLIIVFIALPLMFGIIWTVGITKAAVSPDMIQKLPQIIINEVPEIIDTSIERSDNNNNLDENSMRILKAIKKTGVPIEEVLNKSGLSDWLDKELSESLYKIGEVLKGKSTDKFIYLDMKPLKNSLTNDYFINYTKKVFENLPECNMQEKKTWNKIINEEDYSDESPICKYSNINISFIESKIKEAVKDIPDSVEIFEANSDFPVGVNVSKLTISLSYFLFIIPVLFIIIGSLIADSSKIGFLRWSGYSVLASGVLSFISGYIIKNLINITNGFVNLSFFHSGLDRVLYENISYLSSLILGYLFNPVIKLSITIIIIGIIIIGFSYVIKGSRQTD